MQLENNQIKKHKRWIEQLPGLISTLGVLGTFAGITKGLIAFNTNSLNASIPVLLNGMKTAFFTSLLGMIGSIILNRLVAKKLGNLEYISEAEKSANIIVDALNKNNQKTNKCLQQMGNSITECEVIKKISLDIEQMKDDIEEIKGQYQELNGNFQKLTQNSEALGNDVTSLNENLNDELSRIKAILLTSTESAITIDNNIDTILSEIKEYTDINSKEGEEDE